MSELDTDVLLRAYAYGVFPMAESREDDELYWIDPDQRGIIPLRSFHVPRRLRKTVRAGLFDVRVDTAFDQVIRACAAAAPGREGTWINDRIISLYSELHDKGHAHSVEAWRDGDLVGGLYGVSLGGAFFGESMFSREPDASKVALVHLVARLIAGGYALLDTQFVTDHLRQFGAIEIDQNAYRARLAAAIQLPVDFYRLARDASSAEILQLVSQTS